MAIKLNLTDKQVSGWFCHRRLKDKRAQKEEESQACGKQDISSGIIQDRASGLKQDSCSSTKQAEHRRAEPREVESQRFCHENPPVAELNYQQRSPGDDEMDDTSSESNTAVHESFCPQNRTHLVSETTEYRASNGFVQHSHGRAGPSGYLKIKGQTENAAITAVKRQLGRHYREDGPSLGIEFDSLPPGAFESPSKNIDDDGYGFTEPVGLGPRDISGIHKRYGHSTIRDEDMYETPDDKFSFRQPKSKLPFSNHSRGFPDQKSSFGVAPYSDYNSSRNTSIPHMYDLPGRPHSYGGKAMGDPKDTFSPDHDNVNRNFLRQKEQFSSRPAGLSGRHKDPMYKDDRMPSNRIMKDEELYVGRRPTSEHHDSVKLKMRPPNELKANKRGREEFPEEDYPIRSSPQDLALWSKQRKGHTEMPSNFSEDETAETSSSSMN
ncbi:homeobox-DDT domain protein RLT1-like isoform X2 [Silene latifolia]